MKSLHRVSMEKYKNNPSCNQCLAPFVQLMLDEQGNHSPCAVLDGLWKNKQDVWNHSELESLRTVSYTHLTLPTSDLV